MTSALPWEGEHGLDPAAMPLLAVPGGPVRPLPYALQHLSGLLVVGAGGAPSTLAQVLAGSATQAWVVIHDGTVVDEWYASDARARVLMSISKTVAGMVAGALVGRGLLDPADPIVRYVPELGASGYAGASVRDVLDMRSGVRFREEYTDPTSDIRRLDDAIAGGAGLKAFLTGVQAVRPHGGVFEYRSCDSDVLGWVCERAAGMAWPDLVSHLVWRPVGAAADAAFMCDAHGAAVVDGGMLATAADVARFGLMLLDGGVVEGREVVPRSWLAQIWAMDPNLRAAFVDSAAGPFLPGGWYRNQCWVMPGPHGDVLLGLGIHGQLLRVDPATRTVMVKLSSWAYPQDPLQLYDTLRACEVVAAELAGRAGGSGPRFGGAAMQ